MTVPPSGKWVRGEKDHSYSITILSIVYRVGLTKKRAGALFFFMAE
jgi:hypothetical protein